MFQKICYASTPTPSTPSGLFSPSSAAPASKLRVLTAQGSLVAVRALRLRVISNNVKKLELATTRCSTRISDAAGRNISRFLVKASSGIPLESSSSSSSSTPKSTSWESVKHGFHVFYRFTKPYVILGKIVEVLSMSLLGIDTLSDFSPLYFGGVLKAILATILLSIYIGGLNQLTDIEIDKVNKPNRPLVSGEYSYKTGSLIVAFSAILGFGIALAEGSWPLFGLVLCKFLLGTIYSANLPLMRWKKSPFLTAASMVTLLGVIPPVTYYLHFQMHLLRKPYNFPKSLMFTSALMGVFCMILTLAKDIPDVEGDAKYGIESFAMRFGQKRVFWICVSLLLMVYGASICIGSMSSNPWSKSIMMLGHSVMAVVLWNRAKQTDLTKQDATEAFYMFLWKLFYAEFLLIPFARF